MEALIQDEILDENDEPGGGKQLRPSISLKRRREKKKKRRERRGEKEEPRGGTTRRMVFLCFVFHFFNFF